MKSGERGREEENCPSHPVRKTVTCHIYLTKYIDDYIQRCYGLGIQCKFEGREHNLAHNNFLS